mgnify:CR=1 FL=1
MMDRGSSKRSDKSNDDAVEYHHCPNKRIGRAECPVVVLSVEILKGYPDYRCKDDDTDSGEPVMAKDASQACIAVS